MAATVEARRLTEVHRLAQRQIGTGTVAAVIAAFPLLDPARLDATFDRWATTVIPIVQTNRATSARVAGNYLATFKALELGGRARRLPLELADPAPVDAVTTSLLVTGPVTIKRAVGVGISIASALDTAQAKSAAAAMRHVLDGARTTITDTVNADRQAQGWARVTSGNPCAFCAMVASRGAVYRGEDSAGFEPHDGCACEPEAIYRDDAKLPPGAEQYAELWQQARDTDGDDTANFRALIEGRAGNTGE